MGLKDNKILKVFLIILFGQLLSLCITGTNVTTNVLTESLGGRTVPSTQSFFTYVFLAVIYIPITLYKKGFRHFFNIIKAKWYIFIFWALMDVEGNYFVVLGFGHTNMISAMLISSWSTPAVVILSFFLLKTRYRWTHIVGILVALVGLGLLVYSDFLTSKDYEGKNYLLGDLFCVIGATFYAFSNVIQEYFIHQIEFYEVIALLGLFGLPISGIQLGALSKSELSGVHFSGESIQWIAVFTIIMITFYSLTPILMKFASATFFNISLLTSDFYTLVIGIFAFQVKTHDLYYGAFTAVVVGLFIFNIFPTYKKGENVTNNTNNNDIESQTEK